MSTQSITGSPQYLELANNVGRFIEYWGFKEVHGRIWTLIFLSPEPVDANFLKKTLNVSKALTSMSLKDLLHYSVILEVEKDKPGTQKYTINPDITKVILDIINQRELTLLRELKTNCQSLDKVAKKSPNSFIDYQRLEQLSGMINTANLLLTGMIAGQSVDFNLFDQVMSLQE